MDLRGGDGGSRRVACGPPEKIIAEQASFTTRYLAPLLDRGMGAERVAAELIYRLLRFGVENSLETSIGLVWYRPKNIDEDIVTARKNFFRDLVL